MLPLRINLFFTPYKQALSRYHYICLFFPFFVLGQSCRCDLQKMLVLFALVISLVILQIQITRILSDYCLQLIIYRY